ncbi:MAG TPA: RagB/SusD family nutrient uptake outer membrane protein, partial [Longimicrobiaceae bacterium]|nr:RagB/SusD family nutrient uptake outer membrane protein [Longimicrobiaceae bacterium]
MKYMNQRRAAVAVLAAAALAGACKDISVPDFNRAGIADLVNNPNRTLVDAASAGLYQNARRDAAFRVRSAGTLGREVYYLDPNEPRYASELVTGSIDPSSFAGNHDYNNPYGTIAQGQIILKAVDKVSSNEYTDAQKSAIKGFVYTMMGNDMMIIAELHQYGPDAVNEDPLAPPTPMKTQADMYNKAAEYFDAAVPLLKAGGTAFPFPSPSGMAGFTTPNSTFLQYNRALRSRLDILRRSYAAAKIHLDSSFITTPASPTRATFNLGTYYTYGTGAGDISNGLAAGTQEVADPTLRTDAQLQPSGARDARFLLKVDTAGSTISRYGITSNLRYKMYRTNGSQFAGSSGTASPIPIIRNEDLILMRAEARWFTGDPVGAMADLNYVRTGSGGLAPLATPADDNAFITALLYERRYSIMYEGGYRWLDYRRFNRLNLFNNYPRTGDVSPPYFP